MNVTIVYPAHAHKALTVAAQAFAHLAKAVSGADAKMLTDARYAKTSDDGDLCVVIGNDAENSLAAGLFVSKSIDSFGIRYQSDDYCIRTRCIDGRDYLFLSGGRPRATIYAVYRYFERFCGCRWFWDGDRISRGELVTSDIDLKESPRFEYRGLRYFAHRSLHRFQAEHWSYQDWCCEIDWMLKKRLNLFMLRIGMDDIFQRAFPDVVSYPERDKPLPEALAGYDDRTLFWSLEYRGELRRKILEYAFERDLLHPEDCGTMTHWYSRTPREFLDKVNPELLPQVTKSYGDPTGRVWDIRKNENFDNYFKLTKAHVEHYGRPDIFHTIGLGERLFSADAEENRRMKLYVYRKIAAQIKENYPNAPLFIASWDLWMRWSPEEVRSLISELDPRQSIILDYTSDTMRENNFTKWDIAHKFPWIFGIFSGYEPNSDIRGLYELTNERLKIAKSDSECRGLVLWPELSHGDPFIIEYMTKNAWSADVQPISEHVEQYCRDRYPSAIADKMNDIWQDFLPIASTMAWSTGGDKLEYDIFPFIIGRARFDKTRAEEYRKTVAPVAEQQSAAVSVLERLASIPLDDHMTRRDAFDIARTVLGRFANAAIADAEVLYASGAPLSELEAAMRSAIEIMTLLYKLLGSHSDYSLCDTLERLRSVTDTNPDFERTLKNNAECMYCRAYIYENARYLYLPEAELLFSEVMRAAESGCELDRAAVTEGAKQIKDNYFTTPLCDMRQSPIPFDVLARDAASAVGNIIF